MKLPLRVLVVDDNEDIVQSMSMLVTLWGYQSRVARDGAAALSAVDEFRPDVVLLDIGLPGISGYDVASALRHRTGAHRPILVAMTGYSQEEDRLMSLRAGIDHHLVKPFNPAIIKSLLASLPDNDGNAPEGVASFWGDRYRVV